MKNILVMYSTHTPSATHIENLKKIAPGYQIQIAESEQYALDEASQAEIILGHRYLRQVLPSCNKLQWVQSSASGVDRLPIRLLAQKNVRLTRTTLASPIVARHAYTMAWAIIRGLAGNAPLKIPKTAIIIGYGHIGREIAKLLHKDEIIVYGVKQTPIREKHIFTGTWKQLFQTIDICFLSLPQTAGQVLTASSINKLSPNTVIINIGRAISFDESYAIKLLKQNKLGGLGLDVTNIKETIPGLLVSNYTAAHYPQRSDDLEKYFEQQLYAHINKQPLQNIVTPKIQ